MSILRKGAITRGGIIDLWTLAKPIEKVILDNEEKSTTYAETGATGLLLGTVKLPAPKNQYCAFFMVFLSFEAKRGAVDHGTIRIKLYDGTVESDDLLTHTIDNDEWGIYNTLCDHVGASDTTYSLKGVTTMELRAYLIGSDVYPNAVQYCRNLVVTIVPLYKTLP